MPPAPQANRHPIDARCVRLLTKAENAAAVAPVVETHALSRGDNDVLIEVKAAAVNPSDVKAATGLMPYAVFPRTSGRDYAGVVIDGPPGLIGREVFGSSGDLGIRRDGTHATHLVVEADAAVDKPAGISWDEAAGIGVPFVTAMEGLRRAGLPKPGETVLVNGATGNFGSAAVAVALAMGAACVVAPGRNEKVLADLVHRFGPRVRTVKLGGNEDDDRERMRRAAPGPIDCVLDLMPPSVTTPTVRAAIMTVRSYGRVVLMGGVGMLGGPGLDLPYPWIDRKSVV